MLRAKPSRGHDTADEQAGSGGPADTVTRLFEAEREARRAVREQLESANGRLRAFYKAKPALAETFFLRPGTRKPSRKPRK
jgi:hypothetical protein